MHRTIEDLNATWWYRLLKVIYIFYFIVALFFSWELIDDPTGFTGWLLAVVGIILSFWLLSRIFFYVVIGEFLPRR